MMCSFLFCFLPTFCDLPSGPFPRPGVLTQKNSALFLRRPQPLKRCTVFPPDPAAFLVPVWRASSPRIFAHRPPVDGRIPALLRFFLFPTQMVHADCQGPPKETRPFPQLGGETPLLFFGEAPDRVPLKLRPAPPLRGKVFFTRVPPPLFFHFSGTAASACCSPPLSCTRYSGLPGTFAKKCPFFFSRH